MQYTIERVEIRFVQRKGWESNTYIRGGVDVEVLGGEVGRGSCADNDLHIVLYHYCYIFLNYFIKTEI